MDSKQAAETLRTWKRSAPCEEDAFERGADAIEMLEWMMEITATGPDSPRVVYLYQCWLDSIEGADFRAYCEARFGERAR